MNLKAMIVCSGEQYKTYDCEISIPALKIHLTEETTKSLNIYMPKAQYTSILFMVEGNPVEVTVCKKDNNFYASAKEIAQMNLERMPKLKQNTLVQKYIDNSKATAKKEIEKVMKDSKSNKHIKMKGNNNNQDVNLLFKQAEERLKEIISSPPMEAVAVPSEYGGHEIQVVTIQEADRIRSQRKFK